MKKIIVINLGSTSSKICYYENEKCIQKEDIPHKHEDLKNYKTIWDQLELRKKSILEFIKKYNIDLKSIDAFTSRGGHTIAVESGTYEITPLMLEQNASELYGVHASDLGVKIASILAQENNAKAFIVDPPITDEFNSLAYYSGLAEIKRKSSFHALNHKAVGRKYAMSVNKKYEELNLVIVHMGGGVSVAAHEKGKMIDGPDALNGDGPFSTNRTGSLPVLELIKLCFSGKYTYEDMKKKINGLGGMVSYVDDNDVLSVYNKGINGDEKCLEVLYAFAYQIAKEIGAMATVLKGEVDAILFTGGIANSKYIIDSISAKVKYIAPIHNYPGEFEMESLALNTLKALNNEIEIKKIEDFMEGE